MLVKMLGNANLHTRDEKTGKKGVKYYQAGQFYEMDEATFKAVYPSGVKAEDKHFRKKGDLDSKKKAEASKEGKENTEKVERQAKIDSAKKDTAKKDSKKED